MSEIRVNNITNRDGSTGTTVAGIPVVDSNSHFVVPTGRTGQRYVDGGENIVRDGLVLYLDAKYSYPSKTGITTTTDSLDPDVYTWYDMSGNENHGELKNGVSYSGTGGGSLVFDGTNDYISFPYQNSPFRQTYQITYSFWIYKSETGFKNIMGTSVSGGNGSGGVNFGTDTSIRFLWTPTDPDSDRTISATISNALNSWNYFTFTINYVTKSYQWYQNGIPITSTLNSSATDWIPRTNYDQNTFDYIGARYINTLSYFPGRIAQVSIYNKALTAAEVSQNFEALRSRFGI